MKLSIIILTCDKDRQWLDALKSHIDERVHIQHEVIVMDNTTTQDVPNAIHTGGNKRQLWAKKMSMDYITGDYVWFVDCDDDVLTVEKWPNRNHLDDVIMFDYLADHKYCNPWYLGRQRFVGHNRIYNNDIYQCCSIQMWDKWISASLVKKIYSMLPYQEITASEDKIASMLINKYAKSVQHCNIPLYVYRTDRASSCRDETTLEHFKIMQTSVIESETLIHKLFTDSGDETAYHISEVELDDAWFAIYRLAYYKCSWELPEMIDIIRHNYNRNTIYIGWLKAYNDIPENKRKIIFGCLFH